ncbi:ChaN family lipoprotein [Marichromatium gracile]|nr:ChaN family lipoprotein [Marichromatium gracile]
MSYKSLAMIAVAVVLAATGASVLARDAEPAAGAATRVLELDALTGVETLLGRIAERRVVYVGEHHDRYADHLDQLAVIRGLHARGKPLAIGLECFQQPFQIHLDAYVAGAIDEAQMLRRTEYFERWRFDYRLYRPILRFAREHEIPLIALNLDQALTRRVGEVGIDGLDPRQRAALPAALARPDAAYRERLREIFAQHPFGDERDLDHFIEVQLLWDEGMAARAADYLAANPERTLVVLAGAGHLEYGIGIPDRVERRLGLPGAVLLNGEGRPVEPPAADFYLYPAPAELPPAGLLGVQLGEGEEGAGTRVVGFAADSGAQAAGVAVGDRILALAGRAVADYADIRLALLDRVPGERVAVTVLRGAEERRDLEVELR